MLHDTDWQSRFIHAVEQCFHLAGITCGDTWHPNQHFFNFAFAELLGLVIAGVVDLKVRCLFANCLLPTSARLPSEPAWIEQCGSEENVKRGQRNNLSYDGPFWCDVVRYLHRVTKNEVKSK